MTQMIISTHMESLPQIMACMDGKSSYLHLVYDRMCFLSCVCSTQLQLCLSKHMQYPMMVAKASLPVSLLFVTIPIPFLGS